MNPRLWSNRMGEFILDHTGVSYVLWILLTLFVLTPLATSSPLHEARHFGWMSWVTILYLVDTPVIAVLVDRKLKGQPINLVSFQWALAQGPLLASTVALYDRAPEWFGFFAFVEALVLMIWAVKRARRVVAPADAGKTGS